MVKGSTTSSKKLSVLKSKGIQPFLIEIKETSIKGEIEKFIDSIDILILNVPPGLRKGSGKTYLNTLKTILPIIVNSSIKKVLFVSSTSVYIEDENFSVVRENKESRSDSERAKILLEAEDYFFDNSCFQTSIVRFSGLIGNGRQPAKHLSGKSNVPNPDAPVNLIHLNDSTEVILKIILEDAWGEIFNASFPYNPSRETYYTKACDRLGIEKPHFGHSKKSSGKIVSSRKIIENLNFKFNNPID